MAARNPASSSRPTRGKTWQELTRGLPSADKGKISLGLSPKNSSVVYATIELAGRTGGIWRSQDAGASWSKMSDYASVGTGPHYYQEIYRRPPSRGRVLPRQRPPRPHDRRRPHL